MEFLYFFPASNAQALVYVDYEGNAIRRYKNACSYVEQLWNPESLDNTRLSIKITKNNIRR